MSESALGSVFEISLRILLMLKELFPSKLDEPQVSALDFISVYASDFGLLDENLHGYDDYRFSEYPARKHMVDSALKNLVLDGYVRLFPTPTGYRYAITELGMAVCKQFDNDYAKEHIIATHAILSKFNGVNAKAMLKEINKLTVQSLKEVGHE